jgi:pimeloyl-ACP methyl ester carboxylesterase
LAESQREARRDCPAHAGRSDALRSQEIDIHEQAVKEYGSLAHERNLNWSRRTRTPFRFRCMTRATEILLVPGLWNSGPEHWQSYWERERADCRRVEQSDWDTPRRLDWVETLDRAIAGAARDVVIAAHSLGCATVAHWAAAAGERTREKVRGALLVAWRKTLAPGMVAHACLDVAGVIWR